MAVCCACQPTLASLLSWCCVPHIATIVRSHVLIAYGHGSSDNAMWTLFGFDGVSKLDLCEQILIHFFGGVNVWRVRVAEQCHRTHRLLLLWVELFGHMLAQTFILLEVAHVRKREAAENLHMVFMLEWGETQQKVRRQYCRHCNFIPVGCLRWLYHRWYRPCTNSKQAASVTRSLDASQSSA